MTQTAILLPGTEVIARGLRWEVVASEHFGPQIMYRLRGLENAVLGEEFDVLSPFEDIAPVQHELRPDRAAPLPNWLVYHQAFLLEQALGSTALLAAQPGRLRIEPYQLVPVLRAIRMSRVRLLLADGVGLGKTIQAGLVITELVARRLAHRILIVSPAGPLMDQWQVEMSERFGLRLEVIDRQKLEDVRRSTELGSNPFDYVSLGLVSVDFLKQERVLEQLERASYDVVIIDEAHHCMDVGTSQEREDSQRRRLAEVLARRCDSLILLTATPHDGNDRSFASLCELLDPSLVNRRGDLRGERYRTHVVRRLKKHVLVDDPEQPGKKKPLFPDRVVTPVPVSPNEKSLAPYVELQRRLLDLVAPELRRAFRTRSYGDVLAWIALLKRSVSTVVACERTLSAVASRFQHFLADTAELQEARRQRVRTLREYERRLERFGSIGAEEEQERGLLEVEDLAQQLASAQREIRRGSYQQSKVSDIVAHLDELVGLTETARHHDPKIKSLVETIAEIRRAEPRANVLVFTEYVDSQQSVVAALKAAKPNFGPVITMNGDDDEATRRATTDKFRTNDNLILVSTDSASEGLNLHQRCHHLIHLELPFNPNRLEQRNGRIDRYGQKLEPQVRYLYLRGTFEERILLRLIAKYERQRARLTFVPNTLGITSSEAAEARLLKGFVEEEANLFKEEPRLFDLHKDDESIGASEATRELLEEIDRSLHGFREAAQTNTWLGEAGLNAEENQVQEATEAREEGNKAESVDLARFVCDAVSLDGGEVNGSTDDEHFSIRIPPSWIHGLEHLPGYDVDDRIVRLTTNLDVTRDEDEHQIGFLGRAHPLVRRALDRVRNLSFGGMASSRQDPRASVVKAAVSSPALLYTFLGRVSSRSGREFERVLAVMVSSSGETKFFDSANEWSNLADPSKAIRTTDVWKNHFEGWANQTPDAARRQAGQGFQAMADQFISERRQMLDRESVSQKEWLKQRAAELTGTQVGPVTIQKEFFEDDSGNAPSTVAPQWQSIEDPVQRLAAFHMDRSQTPALRAEADGVLRIFQQRQKVFDSLLDIRPPEVIPLGILMLMPEEVRRGV